MSESPSGVWTSSGRKAPGSEKYRAVQVWRAHGEKGNGAAVAEWA